MRATVSPPTGSEPVSHPLFFKDLAIGYLTITLLYVQLQDINNVLGSDVPCYWNCRTSRVVSLLSNTSEHQDIQTSLVVAFLLLETGIIAHG